MTARYSLIASLAMLLGCSPPSAIQSQLDERFREVADLEAEVRMARADLVRYKTEAARIQAENRPARKPPTAPPVQRPTVTPPPLAPRQMPARAMLTSQPWHCDVCKLPMTLDDDCEPHHVDREQGHPAKLSDADLRIIADGLKIPD